MELNVYHDCWQLLQSFSREAEAAQHACFELFCRSWEQLHFNHLYTAQTNHIEIIQTTLAALHVAKRMACGRRSNGELFVCKRSQRIGGFYLLYCIYNKQPTQDFVKIEISPSTWQALTEYVEQLRLGDGAARRDTQQVSFVFWQLVQRQAFRYTALDYCLALDQLAHYDSLEDSRSKRVFASEADLLNQQLRHSSAHMREELEDLPFLRQASEPLCQLETAYNQKKELLDQGLPATNIFAQLRDLFEDINGRLCHNRLTEEQPSSSKAAAAEGGHLEERQRIRHKARYGEEQRQELTSDKNTTEDEAEPRRCMSLLAVFDQKLTEEVAREYDNGSSSE